MNYDWLVFHRVVIAALKQIIFDYCPPLQNIWISPYKKCLPTSIFETIFNPHWYSVMIVSNELSLDYRPRENSLITYFDAIAVKH